MEGPTFQIVLSNLIFRSTGGTHYDIAKVVHFMYKHNFMCCSIKNNIWYEFRNDQWVSDDCGARLRSKISTDVVREYSLAAANFNNIAFKLKQTPFKDTIMKECREMFYVEQIEDELNSHP